MNLRRAGACLLVLVASACASDAGPVVAPTTTSPRTGGEPTSTAPSASTTSPPRRIIVGGTDAVPDQPPPVGTGNPGSAATRFLGPSGGSRLVVEVLAQEAPPSAVLEHVRTVLAQASGKDVTIEAGGRPPARDAWSDAELRRAAAGAAGPSTTGESVLHLLYVHGSSEHGADALGVAVASDVAAVFIDRVADAAVGLTTTSALLDAVTMHEVGHLLGLVDLVLGTGRADPEHPGHSRSRGSVMYWAVESSLIGDLLTGGPPRDFDAADRADLVAIRGG